jgi:predicted PhzF superfamily epimerase YddE/YHI9
MGPDAVVRVCTPSVELPFAGHPTLGTAYVVGRDRGTDRVTLRMPAGDIPVVGNAFKNTLRRNDRTELLVFLTPRVVNDSAITR